MPYPCDYTVKVNDIAVTVSNATIDDKSVVLTLATAVSNDDFAKVSYTVPTSGKVQDLAGNEAAAFDERLATNNTTGTLVNNTGQSADATLQVGVLGTITYSHAQKFTTADQREDHRFTAVRAYLSNMGSDAIPKVSIYADDADEPGTGLYVLTNPCTIQSGPLNARTNWTAFRPDWPPRPPCTISVSGSTGNNAAPLWLLLTC